MERQGSGRGAQLKSASFSEAANWNGGIAVIFRKTLSFVRKRGKWDFSGKVLRCPAVKCCNFRVQGIVLTTVI